MHDITKTIEKVNKSFLLNDNEKKEFIDYLRNSSLIYSEQEINKLLNDKIFINNFLKSLLLENTKDMTYVEIHNTMRTKYLKKIRELEEKEQENLDNIFSNFI